MMNEIINCERCGKQIIKRAWNHRFCDACAAIVKRETALKYKRSIMEAWKADPKRRKPKLTLQQVAALAKAAGMTYGQYVANMEQEK